MQNRDLQESRKAFYGTIFGTWGIIMLYAVLHDQYLVQISPAHFTDYHLNPLKIQRPEILAAYLGFMASCSPGLTLGVMLYLLGRFGHEPRLPVSLLLKSVLCLVAITEAAALFSLGIVWITRRPLYPDAMYPTHTFAMICSQTVQLTTYFAGFAAAGVLMLWVIRQRRRLRNSAEDRAG